MTVSEHTKIFGLSAAVVVAGSFLPLPAWLWTSPSSDFNQGVTVAMLFVAVASLGLDWADSLR